MILNLRMLSEETSVLSYTNSLLLMLLLLLLSSSLLLFLSSSSSSLKLSLSFCLLLPLPSNTRTYIVFIVHRFYFLRQTLHTDFVSFVPCIVIQLCNVNRFIGLLYITSHNVNPSTMWHCRTNGDVIIQGCEIILNIKWHKFINCLSVPVGYSNGHNTFSKSSDTFHSFELFCCDGLTTPPFLAAWCICIQDSSSKQMQITRPAKCSFVGQGVTNMNRI